MAFRRNIFFIAVFLLFLSVARSLSSQEFEVSKRDTEGYGNLVIFRVKIALDQNYFPVNEREESLKILMEVINEEFQAQGVNVELEIFRISEWRIKDEIKKLSAALDDLREKIPRDNCDLVIGLTARDYEKETRKSEKVEVRGYYVDPGYILVKDYPSFFNEEKSMREDKIFIRRSAIVKIIIHEVGHFFGLEHSNDPNSFMCKTVPGSSREACFLKDEIDSINKAILKMKTKNKE